MAVMMTPEKKIKLIKSHRGPVECPGCKKKIEETEDMSQIEYVRTKRATDVFFHRDCLEKIWN